MASIAEQFVEVADLVEKHATPQAIEKLLARLRTDCESAAAGAGSKAAKETLAHVQQALDTWKSVWPRLGAQKEFRAAVVREARAWSNRLKDLQPEQGA